MPNLRTIVLPLLMASLCAPAIVRAQGGDEAIGYAAPSMAMPLMLASGANALDAVIDVRRPHTEGVTVLAITPGGSGDRMGLRVGDRIIEVNGRPLTGTLEPSRVLAEATTGGSLQVKVVRDDQVLTLSGATTDDAAPVPEGCGYVTTLGTLPHVSERLYPVSIVDIDGGGTPIRANRHRLSAGLHVVIVNERIQDIRFNSVQQTQRTRMQAREGARAGKALVIDVQPNMRYRLGARFLEDNLDSRTIGNNTYWEPLVWQEVEDTCR